jgi:hypothetical protein
MCDWQLLKKDFASWGLFINGLQQLRSSTDRLVKERTCMNDTAQLMVNALVKVFHNYETTQELAVS